MFLSILRSVVLAAVAGLALESGAQSTLPASRGDHDTLVGYWYGEDFQPIVQTSVKSLIRRHADGKFAITFKWHKFGRAHTQTEEGHWGLKDKVYFTRTTSIDGRPTDPDDPTYYDEYHLEHLSADRIGYRHLRNGTRYQGRKVTSEFRVP